MFSRKAISRDDFNKFKFNIKNFKSFIDWESVNIKPLTVICGINNCGKSSLLQALLLLSQSIEKKKDILYSAILGRPIRTTDIDYKTSLLFEGEICHLSDYENILNKYTGEKEFECSFKIEGNLLKITFYNPSNLNIFEAYVKTIEIIGKNYNLKLVANLDSNKSIINYNLIIIKLSFYDFFEHCPTIFPFRRKKFDYESLSNVFIEDYELPNVHVDFNGFIPERVIIKLNDLEREMAKIFGEITIDNKSIMKELNDIKKDFEFIISQFFRRREKEEKKVDEAFYGILEYYEKTFFENILSSIHYIGPLRDEPHRYYQFFDIRNLNIGNKGEYAPQILSLENNSIIPRFKIFKIKENRIEFEYYKKSNPTLKEGLKKWSEILELPEINPEIVEKILFKIMVKLPKIDKEVTLQDVGFGISQILPVYIESLRMEKNHILILEQPEIHLHPSMQSKLADFLLSMAASHKNFIIETHSEYLINRLCLRIAQDPTNNLKDLISIVFIEPPSGDEKIGFIGSKIIDLELNEYGEIKNWPVGFFDQQDYGKMLKAAIDKRKNEKSS